MGAWAVTGLAGAGLAYGCAYFLLKSPEMALVHPEQVEISGNRNVSRANVLDVFRSDRGHSILRIPLGERRRQIESIPWVEQATVRRALPRTIQIDIVERVPIAFLRDGSEMSLVDAHGVIFDRPLQGRFHFPVVSGIAPGMTSDDREKRMQLFSSFVQQLGSARAGAVDQVSEVDLSDAHDLRASLIGLRRDGSSVPPSPAEEAPQDGGDSDAPVLVHFGEGDFDSKYETLMDKMPQWQATAGRVDSVDLRFDGQAVVNSDTPAVARVQPSRPAQKSPAKRSR